MEQSTLHRQGLGLRGVDKSTVCPGHTLYTTLTGTGTVHLVDNDGKEVHKWDLPYRPGRHARLLPNGNLAYNGAHPDAPNLFPMWEKYRGGKMMEVDPLGKIISEYNDPLAHHDQHHMDNGNILYTTLEPLTSAEASTIPGGIPSSEAPDGKVYADCIKQVDPSTGSVLFSWRAIDHLSPSLFPLHPHYAREHWPLINSVYPLRDGNILASLRSVSAVIIISRSTGEVLWYIDSTNVGLAQQHNATELPPSSEAPEGSILIFDNGTFRPHISSTYSRILEVSRQTKKIVWEYRDPSQPMSFFTPFMGGAQRLPNGNTLITEACFGRIFEVTPEKKTCWEFVNPEFKSYKDVEGAEDLLKIGFDFPANALFRAYKYTPEEIPWLGRLPN